MMRARGGEGGGGVRGGGCLQALVGGPTATMILSSVPFSESACQPRHAQASRRYCAPACLCHGHRMSTRACMRVLGVPRPYTTDPAADRLRRAVMHSRQEGPG